MSVRIAAAKRLNLSVLLAALLGLCSAHVFAAGNAEAGQAKSLVCASCHGQDGASVIDPSYPQLAGPEREVFGQTIKNVSVR
jgi:cytochrome c553